MATRISRNVNVSKPRTSPHNSPDITCQNPCKNRVFLYLHFSSGCLLQHGFVGHVTIFLPCYHKSILEDVMDMKQKTVISA